MWLSDYAHAARRSLIVAAFAAIPIGFVGVAIWNPHGPLKGALANLLGLFLAAPFFALWEESVEWPGWLYWPTIVALQLAWVWFWTFTIYAVYLRLKRRH